MSEKKKKGEEKTGKGTLGVKKGIHRVEDPGP